MSRRYWCSIVAAGLVLAITTARAQPVSDDAGRQTGTSQTKTKPADHAEPPADVTVEGGIAGVARALETQIYEPETSKKEERANRDLDAQEGMALWAMRMFWAVLASTCLTAVGVGLIWRTLIYTRQANQAAGDAVRVTRDIGKRQTRAYVHISEFKPFFWLQGTTPNACIQVRIVNSGLSPAVFTGYRLEWSLTNTTDNNSSNANTSLAKRELGPNGDFTIELPFKFGIRDTSKGLTFSMIIRHRYEDVFGETHGRDVKYTSHFSLAELPQGRGDDPLPGHCHGFVDKEDGWMKPENLLP